MGAYVVSLLLEPVERGLGTISAVTGGSIHNTVDRVSTAPARELWFGQRDVGGRSSDVTLEPGHIVYARTRRSERWRVKSCCEKNSLCSLPSSGEWIQNQAQWHPPGGHGGMLAGTWKSVNLVNTQVWFTLKTVKSSGWIVVTLDL